MSPDYFRILLLLLGLKAEELLLFGDEKFHSLKEALVIILKDFNCFEA
jgi:hypothetical protein